MGSKNNRRDGYVGDQASLLWNRGILDNFETSFSYVAYQFVKRFGVFAPHHDDRRLRHSWNAR